MGSEMCIRDSLNSALYSGANAYYRFEITAKKTSGSPTLSVEGIHIFNLTTEYATYTADVLYDSTTGNNFITILNATATDQVLISDFKVLPFGSKDSHGSNNGNNIKMQPPTTSVYGGNAPILPRAVDVAKEGQADAIGNGSASFNGSSDYIDLGDSTDFDITNSITLSAWIKVDAINQQAFIAGRDDGTNRNYDLLLWSDNKIYWNCHGLSDPQAGSSTTTVSYTHLTLPTKA